MAQTRRARIERSERLEARISREQKSLFQRAAALRGLTLTDCVPSTAQMAAHKTIEEFEVLRLSPGDQEAFATILLQPPEPSPRLKRACQTYREHEAEQVSGRSSLTAEGRADTRLVDLPEMIQERLPTYSLVRATLIGRLAVDQTVQGKGLGQYLLMNALERCWLASHQVASFAVIMLAMRSAGLRATTSSITPSPSTLCPTPGGQRFRSSGSTSNSPKSPCRTATETSTVEAPKRSRRMVAPRPAAAQARIRRSARRAASSWARRSTVAR